MPAAVGMLNGEASLNRSCGGGEPLLGAAAAAAVGGCAFGTFAALPTASLPEPAVLARA